MLLKSELKGASNLILIRVGNGKILYCNYILYLLPMNSYKFYTHKDKLQAVESVYEITCCGQVLLNPADL